MQIIRISNGTVTKRANNKFIAQLLITFDSGATVRKTKTMNSKRAAKEALKEMRQKILESAIVVKPKDKEDKNNPANQLYIDYLLGEWLEEKERLEGNKKGTIQTKIYMINGHIRRFFEGVKICDVDKKMIKKFYLEFAKTHKPMSTRHYATVIFNSLEKLRENGVINENPANGIKLPKVIIEEKIPLTKEEIEILLLAASVYDLLPRVRTHNMPCFIRLALVTGMRRGELCGLQWDDINFDNKVIHVRHAVSELHGVMELKGTKTDRPRVIAIPDNVVEMLEKHKGYACGKYVFPSEKDKNIPQSPTNSRHAFDIIRRISGIERLTLHLLRHTNISIMGEHGIDVRTIAARAGHNKLETTMRYLHTNADLNARAANVFNGLE